MASENSQDPKPKGQDKIWNLEKGFKQYLHSRAIDPEQLTEKEYKEARHAYFGGAAQMYVVLILDVPALKDQKLIDAALNYIAKLLNEYAIENADVDPHQGYDKASEKTKEMFKKAGGLAATKHKK